MPGSDENTHSRVLQIKRTHGGKESQQVAFRRTTGYTWSRSPVRRYGAAQCAEERCKRISNMPTDQTRHMTVSGNTNSRAFGNDFPGATAG
jgi:hypothetical protein